MTKKSPILIFCLLIMTHAPRSLVAGEIVEVRFHGNYSIPDDEMARLAEIAPGMPVTDELMREVKERMRSSGRFDWVDVGRRYRSLTETDKVVLIITVKEKEPVSKKFMIWPILSGSDEYGLTYGARITAIDLLGARERISFPLAWGGVRQAAAETQVNVRTPLIDSVTTSGSLSRRENPHFEIGDFRREVQGGVGRRYRRLQSELHGGWTRVGFGALDQSFFTWGAGVALDTRQEVNFPRNAYYAGFGWEKMSLRNGGARFDRFKLDLRGYKGLWGQAILAGQVFYHSADGRLPDYQRPFLGGAGTLRGHKPGAFIGDNLFLTTVELRMPLNSPLAYHRAGVAFFLDSGAVYDHGLSLKSADFKHGAGVGFFVLIAGFGIKVDIAHNLRDSARVHFSTAFRF